MKSIYLFLALIGGSLSTAAACLNTDGANDGMDLDSGPQDSDTDTTSIPTNGWLDSSTGLVWEQPNSDSTMEWADAVEYCQAKEDSGWHLPTIDELRTLIITGIGSDCATNLTDGACQVSEIGDCLVQSCDENCGQCSFRNGPGQGGCYWNQAFTATCEAYWSSSECPDCPGVGGTYWRVYFADGSIGATSTSGINYVICVRDATAEELENADTEDGEDAGTVDPGLIYGLVTYNEGQSIAFTASVSIWDNIGNPILTTETDENDEYEMTVPAGTYSVKAEYPGYYGEIDGIDVGPGEQIKVVVDMI